MDDIDNLQRIYWGIMATLNLGFENQLWEMADKLLGNIESLEYKHVVLGLIFLKYLSDAFEEKYNELIIFFKVVPILVLGF